MNPLYKGNLKYNLYIIFNHHALPKIHVEGSSKPVNESGVTVVIRSLPTES